MAFKCSTTFRGHCTHVLCALCVCGRQAELDSVCSYLRTLRRVVNFSVSWGLVFLTHTIVFWVFHRFRSVKPSRTSRVGESLTPVAETEEFGFHNHTHHHSSDSFTILQSSSFFSSVWFLYEVFWLLLQKPTWLSLTSDSVLFYRVTVWTGNVTIWHFQSWSGPGLYMDIVFNIWCYNTWLIISLHALWALHSELWTVLTL